MTSSYVLWRQIAIKCGCKVEALNTHFGSVSNPKVNSEIVQSESCKILLDDFDFTVSDVELLRNRDDSSSTGRTTFFLFLEFALPFQNQLYTLSTIQKLPPN